MAKKIKLSTDQRPFIVVYQDFLESELLDNHYQKLLYIYLKKFADLKNQCFPSIKTLAKLTKISVNKIKITLAELEKKGVIGKENRTRHDGGKSSNLYTLYDFTELWGAGSSEEVAAVLDEYEEKRLISLLEAKGYTVTKEDKEKEPNITDPTKDQLCQALNKKHFNLDNDNIHSPKSQIMKHYSLEEIHILYDYDKMIEEYPHQKQDIDSVMSILQDNLNTTKPTIRINGEDKPSMTIINKLMKLSHSEIMYAIELFQTQTERIINPISYMLTILYNAKEQFHLDIQNQVAHQTGIYQLKTQKNKFNDFSHNSYNFDELEAMLLKSE